MIDLTSKEETIKHLQHINSTYISLEEPLTFYKSDYRLEAHYLGNMIYMINTKPLDIKIDDLVEKVSDDNE